MKIPKMIRKMSLKDFEEKYGGSTIMVMQMTMDKEVTDVVNTARKRARTTTQQAPETPTGKSSSSSRMTRSAMKAINPNTMGSISETPFKKSNYNNNNNNNTSNSNSNSNRSTRKVAATPATVRAPRNGEMVMSMNGSPIAQDDAKMVATIKKRKSTALSSAIALELDKGDGTFVNLAVPGVVDTMDGKMRKNAVNKLKSLQDEVAALMAQLQ